jgi:hypothetical protein
MGRIIVDIVSANVAERSVELTESMEERRGKSIKVHQVGVKGASAPNILLRARSFCEYNGN